MHASHVYGMTQKTNFNLAIDSFFKIQNLQFLCKKKTTSRKFLDLYLIKIQICFLLEKNFRSVSSENTDQFFTRKFFISVFDENKDLFFTRKFFSDLYLVKIQICFLLKKIFRYVFSENTNLLILKKKKEKSFGD